MHLETNGNVTNRGEKLIHPSFEKKDLTKLTRSIDIWLDINVIIYVNVKKPNNRQAI